MPHDLHLFDQIDNEFTSHAISSVDIRQILVGRPHGGLTILWRKNIAHLCDVITFDDNRILGIKINCPQNPILALNIYLLYYSDDNYEDYMFYIGKLMSIIEEVDNWGAMVRF